MLEPKGLENLRLQAAAEANESPPLKLFSARLKVARALRGWTQRELATLSNLPNSCIGHYEEGTRKPTIDSLLRLSIALEVTVEFLVGRVAEPNGGVGSDPLYLSIEALSGTDRALAKDFIKMLAERRDCARLRKASRRMIRCP